ncbi:MAG TPA: phage tail protein, partial [Ramlibacter sp.]
MAVVSIVMKHNFPDVQRQLGDLHRDVRDLALIRAINRTVAPALPQMAREISREFNLTASKAKESLVMKRASFKQGRLMIEASLESPSKRGRSLNLIHFVEKTVTLSAARRRQAAGEGGSYQLRNGATVSKALELRFKIKRGGPWKVIKGAFIGNEGRTVFQREGT